MQKSLAVKRNTRPGRSYFSCRNKKRRSMVPRTQHLRPCLVGIRRNITTVAPSSWKTAGKSIEKEPWLASSLSRSKINPTARTVPSDSEVPGLISICFRDSTPCARMFEYQSLECLTFREMKVRTSISGFRQDAAVIPKV